jgi:FMN phosphatase YigB (HAD superfamily)
MEKEKVKIVKMFIWDFDGTLVDSPLPEFGKVEYKNKTGNDWVFEGWWGKPLSLSLKIFDIPKIESVTSEYDKVKSCETICKVMLTGRIKKLSEQVKEILESHELKFDEYHYNNGGSTEISKIKTMDSLLEKYPDVREINMWDDRLAHIPIFKNWGDNQIKLGRIDVFNITVVPSTRG